MKIHCDFQGGNIEVLEIGADNHIHLEPSLRDTSGKWFYWAFCVQGAAGKTLTFHFDENYVGYFGPAVSRDLKTWCWAGADCLLDEHKGFTYHFSGEDDCVYFAHHMLYSAERFFSFAKKCDIPVKTLTHSNHGADVPYLHFGDGKKAIVLTARHHCCESTGSYVLEGVIEHLIRHLPSDYCVIAVPFMDMDGVLNGDQGKNRIPHDHNRDYIDNPIYAEVKALMQLIENYQKRFVFDFHSPWHLGGRNDHVFFVQNYKNPKGQEKLSKLFVKACEQLPLRYTGEDDIAPNEGWNTIHNTSFAGHYAEYPEIELSFTLENAYFGILENKCEQDSLVKLGHAFAKALCEYINFI